MENIPNLDELLSYGEEYQYPELIMSDYFSTDNSSQKEDNNQQDEEENQKQSSEQENEDSLEESKEHSQDPDSSQTNEDQGQEQSSEQQTEESQNSQQQSDNLQGNDSKHDEASSEDQENNGQNENDSEQEFEEQSQGQSSEKKNDEFSQEESLKEQDEELQENDDNHDENRYEQQENDENDFENLMNNYDENTRREQENKKNNGNNSASDKLDDITTTKIYRVLKKLVSLSYERFQKGTYKYDKKEIVKHYLTNQKFRIVDDLVSPTFKPDVYVFDLSPSNDEFLELYVNAISSVAIKDSLIYLTYNDSILRKLLIKKQSSKNIDVNEIVNSNVKSYSNFECTVFDDYCSLYEELKDIKDRRIYIFSDFDISRDISKLSQKNQDIVWFSTENAGSSHGIFYREYPKSYMGYYVDTARIEDIEKFIKEKNKTKYKGRFRNG